jgi:hypothetical protein
MGPACIVKSLAGGSFSMTVFGLANVAMDMQPLWHLWRGEGIVHGVSHSLLGATVIGALCALLGCQRALNLWTPEPADHFQCWLRGPRVISWPSAVVAAFTGTYSHVVLDAMIHADVHPFAPFDQDNLLLGDASFGAMHLVSLGMGLLGLVGLAVRYELERGGT